jgi:hypothetical protein
MQGVPGLTLYISHTQGGGGDSGGSIINVLVFLLSLPFSICRYT